MTTRRPSEEHEEDRGSGLSRRKFLKGASGAAVGSVIAACQATETSPPEPVEPEVAEGLAEGLAETVDVTLSINGERHKLRIEPRTTLLNALRYHLAQPLTGTKLVCDRGNCGACTVMVDGRPAYACLLLAADLEGREVKTIESLGSPDALSPVQQAFWEHDASMCGFCTPGFVVSITAALDKNPKADVDEIRAACSGNVCRCGTYPQVFRAALDAGRKLAGGRG